jgi:hypothetical protein
MPVLPMQKPAGGLPSPLTQGTPGLGAVTQPNANQGNIQQAMTKVTAAIKMLEEALPMVPMGNDLHTEILNSAKALSKHLKEGEGSPALMSSSVQNMLKNNSQAAPMAALARMFQPGQGQPPATAEPPQPPAA